MADFVSSFVFRQAVRDDAKAATQLRVVKEFTAEAEVDDVSRRVKFIITTGDPDRENDTVASDGWDVSEYMRSPVILWAHDYKSLPIAKAIDVTSVANGLSSTAQFPPKGLHPFADTVFELIRHGFIKAASVGFKPKLWNYNETRGGIDHLEQTLLEWSVVPVPANAQALVAAQAAGIDTAVLKDWAERTIKALDVIDVTTAADTARRFMSRDELLSRKPVTPQDADPIRWNRQLSKAFDVDEEPLQASTLEYTWVSRFLQTPVKDLYETTVHVSGARIGAFLSALDDSLGRYKVEALRNMTQQDKEVPPVYETIQLNSKLTRSFLVEGLRFVSGPAKMVVKVQPSWSGIAVTLYIASGGSEHAVEFLVEAGHKARQYKFLKGEAFSLSGEFLARDGTTTFDSVFLEERNIGPMRRVAQLVNERGAAMECRGAILMGPPGVGKTLIARAMMNECKDATYIWVSARDLWRSGAFGGVSVAFDLARENAPSIICMEDIDNELDSYVVDLLKSEMDGIQQHKGVVTIITTNFPQQIPKALIDRPGRFHDVLQFDLPSEAIRRRMLDTWAPEASVPVLASLAKETAGLSGAHLRELVRFGETIRLQDSVSLDAALGTALAKIKEQRELIDQLQSQQPRWRAVKPLRKAFVAKGDDGSVRRTDKSALVEALYKAGAGTCDRCGHDGSLACGVCAECANAFHPWDHQALIDRTSQFARETLASLVRTGAAREALAPFNRDIVAWKALVKARDRIMRREGVLKLSDDVVCDLLADYGFEAEAAALKDASPVTPPDVDGRCPDGYAIGTDGLCHMPGKDCGAVLVTRELFTAMSETVTKRGRKISKANETKLRGAHEALGVATSQIGEVLAQVEAPVSAEDDDDEDMDGKSVGKIVLVLADDDPDDIVVRFEELDEERIDIGEALPLIGAAVSAALRDTVQRELTAALNAVRGRVD